MKLRNIVYLTGAVLAATGSLYIVKTEIKSRSAENLICDFLPITLDQYQKALDRDIELNKEFRGLTNIAKSNLTSKVETNNFHEQKHIIYPGQSSKQE